MTAELSRKTVYFTDGEILIEPYCSRSCIGAICTNYLWKAYLVTHALFITVGGLLTQVMKSVYYRLLHKAMKNTVLCHVRLNYTRYLHYLQDLFAQEIWKFLVFIVLSGEMCVYQFLWRASMHVDTDSQNEGITEVDI